MVLLVLRSPDYLLRGNCTDPNRAWRQTQ